ncbi:TetR/AcrR family transcriptional regulator [Blastococcus sp. SYSU D00820]
MRHSPERREEILARSAELFATRGVAATTVRDIGDAAGVFSGSLYHYFPSKHAIVGELLGRFMADIQGRFAAVVERAGSPEETLRGLVLATLQVIDEHPHPTAIYQRDRQYLREHGLLEPVDTASRAVRGHWLAAIEAGVADGSFRDDVPAHVFYRALRDSLWASMHWPNRRDHSTEEFAEVLGRLFFDGLRRR